MQVACSVSLSHSFLGTITMHQMVSIVVFFILVIIFTITVFVYRWEYMELDSGVKLVLCRNNFIGKLKKKCLSFPVCLMTSTVNLIFSLTHSRIHIIGSLSWRRSWLLSSGGSPGRTCRWVIWRRCCAVQAANSPFLWWVARGFLFFCW